MSGVQFNACITDKYGVNIIGFKFMKDMKIRFLNHERKEFIINGNKFIGVMDIKVERLDKVSSMMDFYVTYDSRVSCLITSFNAKKLKLTPSAV